MCIKNTISTHVIKNSKNIQDEQYTLHKTSRAISKQKSQKIHRNTTVEKGRQPKKGHQNPFKTVN